MSVSSLLRSARSAPQLMPSMKRLGASALDARTSRIAHGAINSLQNGGTYLSSLSQSADSLASLASRVSSIRRSSSSLGSLSSWISDDLKEGSRQQKVSAFEDKASLDGIYSLPSRLAVKIEEHKETGHKFIILTSSSEQSRFLFFPQGDLSKKMCFSVYKEDTVNGIASEVDLRDMIRSFCFMQADLEKSWEKTSAELSTRFQIKKKKITYNLLLIHFDYQTAIAFSSPSSSLKGLSQFRGTKLAISKDAQERIKEILEQRAKKHEPDQK